MRGGVGAPILESGAASVNLAWLPGAETRSLVRCTMDLFAALAARPVSTESSVTTDGGQKLVKVERRGAVSTASAAALRGEAPAPAGHFLGAPAPSAAPAVKLTAQGFLDAIRNAGKVKPVQGAAFHDTTKEKDDKIAALRAFTGYSPGQPLGVQIDNAIRAARRAVAKAKGGDPDAGVVTQRDKRAAFASAAGYVAGSPEGRETRRRDLVRRLDQALRAESLAEIVSRRLSDDPTALVSEREREVFRANAPETYAALSAALNNPGTWAQAHLLEKAKAEQIEEDLLALG